MSTLKLSGFGLPVAGASDVSHPQPERLISGNPRRDTWSAVETGLAGLVRRPRWMAPREAKIVGSMKASRYG